MQNASLPFLYILVLLYFRQISQGQVMPWNWMVLSNALNSSQIKV